MVPAEKQRGFFCLGRFRHGSLCCFSLAVVNGRHRAHSQASKAHKALVLHPGGAPVFHFDGFSRANLLAMTTTNAAIVHREIVGVQDFVKIDTRVKACRAFRFSVSHDGPLCYVPTCIVVRQVKGEWCILKRYLCIRFIDDCCAEFGVGMEEACLVIIFRLSRGKPFIRFAIRLSRV